jgi:hypothetical protein
VSEIHSVEVSDSLLIVQAHVMILRQPIEVRMFGVKLAVGEIVK